MFCKYIFPQLSFFFCVLIGNPVHASAVAIDTRSDSFNVSHYSISLDLNNLSTKALNGSCMLSGVSVINGLDRLSLELYKLNVDSVIQNGKKVVFQYNDSLLTVKLDRQYNAGDSFLIKVWYDGKPVVTSWGGFYFDPSNNYAFNLGISINQIPHNFARVWFPCVDNFIDKAKFSFYIKSKNNQKAFCNGLLIDSSWNADNTLTWHWEMRQPIVPYLASVAVGVYQTLYSSFKSITGVVKPVMIGVLPGDSGIAMICFQHLKQVLAEYENAYGPYPFDRVGFVGVNFTQGAMEHASNIALPNEWIEDGLKEEYLWAHELSHQWWGDNVTCSSADDMWLNEGWACYNEGFYQEKLYGVQSYNAYAMGTRYQAIRYAQIMDSSDLPISPMPQKHTYGITTYEKGSCAVRALRDYLGDSLFFIGIKAYQHDLAYGTASSAVFENEMTKATGVDLSQWFNEWIFGKGWPHYEISGTLALPNGHLRPQIELRNVDNNFKYNNTPLTVNSFDASWHRTDIPFKTDSMGSVSVQLPVNPLFFALDMDGKVPDASTKQYLTIKATGTYNLTLSLMTLNVDSLKDSALVYVVHNWIRAVRTQNTPKNIRISSERYWTVDGIMPAGFHAAATIQYDGRALAKPSDGGYLDNDFLKGRLEDSIVLMYKPIYGGDWIVLNPNTDYIKTMGNSHTDENGTIRIMNLKAGKYCFGLIDVHAGIALHSSEKISMNLFPNPASNTLNIKFKEPIIVNSVQIYDSNGKIVKNINLYGAAKTEFKITDLDLPHGSYILNIATSEGVSSQRFVVVR